MRARKLIRDAAETLARRARSTRGESSLECATSRTMTTGTVPTSRALVARRLARTNARGGAKGHGGTESRASRGFAADASSSNAPKRNGAREGSASTNAPAGKYASMKPRGAGEKKTQGKNGSSSSNGSGGESGGGPEAPKTLADLMRGPGGQQLASLALLLAGTSLLSATRSDAREISFQEFKTKLLEPGLVERIEVSNKSQAKVYVKAPGAMIQSRHGAGSEYDSTEIGAPPGAKTEGGYKFYFNIGSLDSFERKLEEAQELNGQDPKEYVPVTYVNEFFWQTELMRLLPTLLLIGGWLYFTRRSAGMGGMGGGMGGGAGGIFNVGKATVATLDKNAKNKVMFKDVAGCNEAKREIMEFVDFLKNPKKYEALGAKIPHGALLVGPPGTGKTLLAKATAGEAGVPFLSISGSDFMEMFVGVGPSRVRDLFAQARQQKPSIIFIDEIDAIGRQRGRSGFAGGNDERENTLNQLLVEMDGFGTKEGVIVLAGTNRPDILDRALLRPGRFDRQITVDRPDIQGREQIFRVHLANITLDGSVEHFSERLAALTPGFAGADIANMCNEAALAAARDNMKAVSMSHFEYAADRVIAGLEKKSKVVNKTERRTVAYHEAGHAVVGWFLEHAEPLLKVSIVPRGSAALGFAQYLPNENLLATTQQLIDMMCMTLGGRAAEQVMLGKISTGAQNDLEKVTQMAYNTVAVYGMNEKIGLLSFPKDDQSLKSPYSEDTARMIDEEVRVLVDTAYKRTLALVEEKKHLIEAMAQGLLDKEVLQRHDLVTILGERPFTSENPQNIDILNKGFNLDDFPKIETSSESESPETPDEPETPDDEEIRPAFPLAT